MYIGKKKVLSIFNGYVQSDADMFNKVYPVGSIYTSASETSPAELFGGTWEKIEGKFLLTASDSYGLGSTGGSADAVVVAHNHDYQGWSLEVCPEAGTDRFAFVQSEEYDNANLRLQEAGVDGTGKNMPPYLVVNAWKRIA
jgi:hypothetical protein